jgi:uncharacterized protein (TIGR03643 family)
MDDESLIRIIEMAWEDRTPFDAISLQFGIKEGDIIKLMRNNLKLSSFKLWRKRVQGRKTKHKSLTNYPKNSVVRFKCKMQRQITGNKISKR